MRISQAVIILVLYGTGKVTGNLLVGTLAFIDVIILQMFYIFLRNALNADVLCGMLK